MSIYTKLKEIQEVNKIRGNSDYTKQCVYKLGEKELVVVKSYMLAKELVSETQAVRELILRGGIDFTANGGE